MSGSGSEKSGDGKNIEIIKVPDDGEFSSGDEVSRSEWSSLELEVAGENKKRALHAKGLYDPGSGNICTDYISLSNSEILRHVYYNYPAVIDPGIEDAILHPHRPIVYPDDGQLRFQHLCEEMNICPIRIFHRNLLNDEINLSYYSVNPKAVRAMALALQYNKHVRILNLTDNFLNDDACYHLGQMLTSNITLQELNLAGCRIGPTGIARIGINFHINRTLKTLNIARNNIGDDGGVHIAHQIENGATIPKMNLSYNKFGQKTALALWEAFEYIPQKITHLDLSYNNFATHLPSFVKLLNTLAQNDLLEELNLAWNSLEGERVANAIKMLLFLPNLKILDLSNNKFANQPLEIILSNLMNAKHLHTFDLSGNPLTVQDAFLVIQKMLRPRVKIQNLYLDNICVDKTFVACLERVRKMKSRKDFVITYGNLTRNYTIEGPDPRELVLRRLNYLGSSSKKFPVDVALFFLRLFKNDTKPIGQKDLADIAKYEHIPLDEGLSDLLVEAFPGPKTKKQKFVDLAAVVEYIRRLWPDRRLPPTPPPEPIESATETEPQPKKTKGKT